MPYDPFVRGRFAVGVRTIEALDTARGRLFPVEIWYPAAAQHVGEDIAPGTQDVFKLLNHLVRAQQHRLWNCEAKCFGGFQVHHELERYRLLHGAVHDTVGIPN
jgi:hypothetical protein